MKRTTTQIARRLRKNSTDAEKLLWRALRSKPLDGVRFRRQQPISSYIVDFACFEKRLVLEIDGGQHADAIESDRKRDEWLRTRGFTVLRFWNNQVMENLDGVIQVIGGAIRSPSPSSPPVKGGET